MSCSGGPGIYGRPTALPGEKTALVVEGGGMRGIFAAGVLDSFLRAGFNPFDLLIGVSSGSVTLASYLSGQYQRYLRIVTGPMNRREFLSVRRFLKGGHLMDLDWLWRQAAEFEPLDTLAATSHPGKEYLLVGTDVETAEPVYLRPGSDNLHHALKASCALPVMYRAFVSLDGRLVADGGVADPLPVREAYRRGARTVAVIRTRPEARPKGFLLDCLLSLLFLRKYPKLQSGVRSLHTRYKDAVHFIHHPPPDARVIEIAPPAELRGARLSMDPSAIRSDYSMGRHAGEAFLSCWDTLAGGSALPGDPGKTIP